MTSQRGAAGRAACSHEQLQADPHSACSHSHNGQQGDRAARSEAKMDMEDVITAMT